MRFDSGANGSSTDVGIRTRCGQWRWIPAHSSRTDTLPFGSNWPSKGASSRVRPSRRCSGSIALAPYCDASYRAKKITRRAFSVYRSNIIERESVLSTEDRTAVNIQNFAIDMPGPLGTQENNRPGDVFRRCHASDWDTVLN